VPDSAAPAELAAAMARHRAGDLTSARSMYRRYLEKSPQDAGAWCLLASMEGQCGDHAAAAQAFRKAIAASPDQAQGHAGLGTSMLMVDQPAAAVDALRRALELDPDLADARYQLAVALHRAQRSAEAAEVLEQVLDQHPGHLQARYNLGAICLEQGRPERAVSCFQAVLAQDKRRVPAWVALARAQMALDQVDDAEASLEEALRLAPGDVAGRAALGRLLQSVGRLEEARDAFAAVLKNRPRDPLALAGSAELDLHLGHAARGLELLAPALELDLPALPIMVAAARLWLDSGAYQLAADRLGQWVADPRVGPEISAGLHRLRGDALDALGRHQDAWAAWTSANRAVPARFDPARFAAVVDALIGAFPDIRPAPAGWTGPQPVLLVGLPRAGKSICEQMLACHPDIRGAGELRVLNALTETVRELSGSRRSYPACMADVQPETLETASQNYASSLARRARSASHLSDTQPTNFMHVGLAASLCPGLRVIYCRRRPLDLALACYARGFADQVTAFSTSPEWIGAYLANVERLMSHWQSLDIQILDVEFEHLVADPEGELRRMLDFLRLEWSDRCAAYHDPTRSRLSVPPVLHGPLDPDQLGRGDAYREQLAPVLVALDQAQRKATGHG
jgi:tetratricopeptide (TPR) repeat protein